MPYAEPTPAEVEAFAATLDLQAVAKEMLCLKRHLDTAGELTGIGSRNAALGSLLGLIEFVKTQLRYQVIPPALTGLHMAVAALDDGVVLPLLQKKQKHAGRPVSEKDRILHGYVAAVMNCLMKSGFDRLKAGRIVGAQLQKLGVKIGRSRNADIGKSVANWRAHVERGNPTRDIDAEVYRNLCAMFKPSGCQDADKKTLIEMLHEGVRNLG
jgi:hypothetical protein